MGIRSPFDRDSSSSHIVDKMIGNAYPVVRKVYDSLDAITYLADNTASILEAGEAALSNQENVTAVLAAAEAAQDLIDNLGVNLGYLMPVEYAAGINLTTATQTVEYGGLVYAPLLSVLPYSTPALFDPSKFKIVSLTDLTLPTGSSKVGHVLDYLGYEVTTLDKVVGRNITLGSFIAAGTVLHSAALQNAANAAHTAGVTLQIENGVYFLDSPVTLQCAVSFGSSVSFTAAVVGNGDVPPVMLHFVNGCSIEGASFNNMIVSCSAAIGDNVNKPITPMQVMRSNFYNASLQIGQQKQATAGYFIEGNTFVSDVGRVCDGIFVENCSSTLITKNKFRGYLYGVKVSGTIGFSQSGITVKSNKFERVNCGIGFLGRSYCRISNSVVEHNSVTQDRRDSLNGTAAIELDWCNLVSINRNTVSGSETTLRLRGCIDLTVYDNTLNHVRGVVATTWPVVSLGGCHNVKIRNNRVRQAVSGGYSIITAEAGVLTPVLPNSFYKSTEIVIDGNELFGVDRAVKIDTTQNVRVTNNKIVLSSEMNATAKMLIFGAGCTGYYLGNYFNGLSGTPVNNLSSGGVTNVIPSDVLTVVTPPTHTNLVGPVITVGDVAVNGAKSYVVTFKLTDVTALKQLCDESTAQKLSSWVGTMSSPTVAWNTAPWNSTGDQLVKDLIVDGGLHSRSGAEEYVGTRSAVVIDRYGYLTCRDFHVPVVVGGAPVLCPTTALEESAWQTVSFRPPLVIDGAVYDPRTTGLMGNTTLVPGSYNILHAITETQIAYTGGTIDTWSQRISARTALGQKADGTFVLVIVDGRTNSAGCSKKQLAQKLVALGCINAYNLDGGGSATLWYSGNVVGGNVATGIVNTPSDTSVAFPSGGAERNISAVMYI